MIDALTVMQGAMANDVQRMHAISQNLANVSTPGFKRERVVAHGFVDYLRLPAESGLKSTVAVQSPLLQTYTDFSSGTLHRTGAPLDVAVEGNGFLVVQTPRGEAYTRQGNLHLDSSGQLVTGAGLPLVGDGGAIRLTDPNPRIDQQGRVHDGGRLVGQIRVVNVSNPGTLADLGAGLFAPTPSTALDTNAQPRVRQGFNETSNVVSMNQMVKLIDTVRHFESSQRVIKSYSNMLDRAINVLGTF